MAVSYTLSNYALLSDCNTTTGWSGGNAITTEVDFYKYGTQCVAYTVRQATTYQLQYTGTFNLTTGSPIIRLWFLSFQTFTSTAAGGIRFYIKDGTNTAYWNILGQDTYPGGWYMIAVDTGTTQDSGTKPTMSAVTGIGLDITTIATTKNAPSTFIDHLHRADGIAVYGDASTGVPFGFSDIYTLDNTTSTAWGFLTPINTVYFANPKLTVGDTGTNNTLFSATDQVFVFDGSPMAATHIAVNATKGTGTTDIDLTRCVFKGSLDSFDVGFSTTLTSLDINGCSFINARIYSIYSGAILDGTSFVNCGAGTISTSATNCTFSSSGLITQGTGGSFDGCVISNGTATASILSNNLSAITNCDFVSDGSNHAIQLDSSHAGNTYNLVGCTFTSYATTDGSTGNEVIYNDSGGAVTIYVSGVTGTVSVRNGTSATTTLIINPVTTSVKVVDSAGSIIEGARVLVWVTDNANYFYQATVSITGTGTTATVSHTAHGMETGDNVIIEGVTNDDTYNGAYSVTVTGVNAYTYTTNETISIGTATGTIRSTFAVIHEVTGATGIVTDTRSWPADQTISGRVRKSSSSPYYIQGNITGTIDSESGFATIIQLVSDE